MSIRKNKQSGIWWIDITPPGGKRIRRSAGTRDRKQAQEYHDRLKAELWRSHQLGDKPKRLFEEVCVRYLTQSQGTSDYDTKVRHVKYWREQFAGRAICSLTSDEIQDGLPTHQSYQNRPARKLAAGTRNRYLTSITRILSIAKESGWIDVAPTLKKENEASVRVRWLTHGQAATFINALCLPWMRDVCRFALATGCRANEIFTLTWDKLDEHRSQAWVTNDLAKSGVARSIPLNDDAMAVIEARKGIHKSLIFARMKGGKRIKQVDRRDFLQAMDKAKIKDFRFHDLRHTWASWHVQSGTPLFVLKELGGWETIEMVKKYAHLDAGHLAQHVNAVTFRSQQEQERLRATG